MKRHWSLMRFAGAGLLALVLSALLPAAASAAAAPLVDDHWVLAGPERQRVVELRVLVTNTTSSELVYHVRFTAEWSELATVAAANKQGDPPARAAVEWEPVEISVVPGGSLPVGATESVTTQFPADILRSPKAYRFRAELLDSASGAVLAEVIVTKRNDIAAALLLPAAALAASRGGSEAESPGGPPEPMSGSGTMVGTHEARRVGSEWVEHGSGTIKLRGRGWSMVIEYTYDGHGTSAATLTATATGTGTARFPGRQSLPVTITSASARMLVAGNRTQDGTLIVRTGCAASGTFEGTVGGDPYRGVVTMAGGRQTLDLATGKGEHAFRIQFTAMP